MDTCAHKVDENKNLALVRFKNIKGKLKTMDSDLWNIKTSVFKVDGYWTMNHTNLLKLHRRLFLIFQSF